MKRLPCKTPSPKASNKKEDLALEYHTLMLYLKVQKMRSDWILVQALADMTLPDKTEGFENAGAAKNVQGFGLTVLGLRVIGFKVLGSEFCVSCLGYWVQGFGLG